MRQRRQTTRRRRASARLRVTEKGGAFFYNDTKRHDVPLDNIAAFKKTMQDEKPHLLPRAFESSLADRAFIDGNLSARGELIKQVGELEANRIAQSGMASMASATRAALARLRLTK